MHQDILHEGFDFIDLHDYDYINIKVARPGLRIYFLYIYLPAVKINIFNFQMIIAFKTSLVP